MMITNIFKETILGDNIRIGSNAAILPIKIGNNSIIGAGAVITKNIPSNCVIAGNPAKIIRIHLAHNKSIYKMLNSCIGNFSILLAKADQFSKIGFFFQFSLYIKEIISPKL